jgi:hypothetical protein
LSVMPMDAERLPVTNGEKVAVMVQLPPAATVFPQLLVSAKSLLFVPVMAMLEMVRTPVPLLVSVTVCPGLVVFTS